MPVLREDPLVSSDIPECAERNNLLGPGASDVQYQAPTLPDVDPIELFGTKVDVQYYLRYDYDDVATAAQQLPAIAEWLNMMLQRIAEARNQAEDEVKQAEAKAWFHMVSGGFEDLGYAGRKTAQAVLMAVRLDPTVVKKKADLAILDAWRTRLINTIESFRAKLELVRTSEATRRRIFDSQTTSQPYA